MTYTLVKFVVLKVIRILDILTDILKRVSEFMRFSRIREFARLEICQSTFEFRAF